MRYAAMSTPGFSDQPVPILVPRSWPRAGALDSINQYSAVVIIDGLVAILFMIGYVLFGVAMIRTGHGLAGPASWSQRAPRPTCWGFGIAQPVSTGRVAEAQETRGNYYLQHDH
jgi:hypothetical protein